MFAISLIFVGITLILNGFILWKKTDKVLLVVLNLFTAAIIFIFNIYAILVGNQDKLVGYMGGLLFGLTNLLIAFENLFEGDEKWTGYFCLIATVCALAFSTFYFVSSQFLLGGMWIAWSLIWLSTFIGASLTKKFMPFAYVMYILQGILTTGGFGFLLLFKIVEI